MYHTRAFFLITSSFAVLLSGCVNIMAEKPQIATATNPIQYADQFMAAAEKGLINPYNLIPVFIKDEGDHQVFHRVICAKRGSKKEFQNGIRRVCKNMNGWVAENGLWCRDEQSGQPLFMAQSLEETMLCGTTKSLEVTVWAPSKNMSSSDPNWLSYAKSFGFEERARPKHLLTLEDLLGIDLNEGVPRPSPKFVDFSVRMTSFGPQVWDLTLNKTRIEDLPKDCFFHNPLEIPVDDLDFSHSLEGPTLGILPMVNEGGVSINSTNKISQCYGSKVKDVFAQFTNGVLTSLSFSVPPELQLKILSALGPLRKTEERIDCIAYEGNGFYLRWDRSLPNKQKARQEQEWDHVYISSHRPKLLAKEFFQKNGYPKHGPMELEHSTKESLSSFMRKHNFIQQKRYKFDESYFAILNMFPLNKKFSKQMRVGYRLDFHTHGPLKEIEIEFDHPLTKAEVESLLGKDFVYIGKTSSLIISLGPNAEQLDDYVYWHKDYTPKKTGSFALFTVHAHYGKKTGRIRYLRLASLPNEL